MESIEAAKSFGGQLKFSELQSLSIIFMITSVSSFIGSISVIILTIKRRVVTRRNILPLFQLFLADALVSLGVIVGASSNRFVVNRPDNSLKFTYRTYCIAVTMFTTACYMVTFLLTINYAFQSYIMVSEKLEHPHKPTVQKMLTCCNWEKWFPIFSWIFPTILAILITFLGSKRITSGRFILDSDICTWCFPLFFYQNSANCSSKWDETETTESKYNRYYIYKAIFLGMIALTLVLVLILFYFVFTQFRRLLQNGGVVGHHQHLQVKKLRNRTMLLFAVLVFCWIIPLILGFISLGEDFSMSNYFSLYVIEALTSPLQGFLNSIVYGWFNIRFRNIDNNLERPLIRTGSSTTSPDQWEPE